jgi:EpsI family protein
MISTRFATQTGAAPSSALRSMTPDVLLILVVGFAILFAHHQALWAMIALWQVSPMYSYGFTVPLISAYLVWTRREELSRLTPRPAVAASAGLVLLSVVMVVAARAGGIQILDQLAFLVSLMAGVLLLFGFAHLKQVWAAVAYLLLMIPIWDGLTERLHEPFQLRSAAIGTWLLQTVGVPAYRQGMIIDLPNVTLEVARACSGVNYLVAVMALGLPLAYLYLPTLWRRVALLVSALIVAALSNGLRVALIGLLAYLEIGSPLHGPFHVLHGLFVAGIGYVVLFAGLRVLTPTAPTGDTAHSAATGRNDLRVPSHSRPLVATAAALAASALFVIVGFNGLSRSSFAVSLDSDLSAFPQQLGPWVAQVGDVSVAGSPAALWTGADVELRRRYVRADGATSELFVGYFSSQTQGREVVNHRATELHGRASRWRLPMRDGRTFDVNYARAGNDGIETVFWYEVGRGPEANRFLVKARTLLSAMSTGQTNAAVVVLMTRSEGQRATVALQELAPLVEAALAARLPGSRQPAGL